jgi:hypothetical protein
MAASPAPVVDEWVKTTADGARVFSAYRAELARAIHNEGDGGG